MFKRQYSYVIRNKVLKEDGFYLFKPFINFKNFYYLFKPHVFFNNYCISGKHSVMLNFFDISRVFSYFIFFQNICHFFYILKIKLGFLKCSRYFSQGFNTKSLFFTVYGINSDLLCSFNLLMSGNILKSLTSELFERLIISNLLVTLLAISKLNLSSKGIILCHFDSTIYSFLNVGSNRVYYNIYGNLPFLIHAGFLLFLMLAFSSIVGVNSVGKLFVFGLKKKQVSYFKLKLGLFGFIRNAFF